jgi:hypothetical protein
MQNKIEELAIRFANQYTEKELYQLQTVFADMNEMHNLLEVLECSKKIQAVNRALIMKISEDC